MSTNNPNSFRLPVNLAGKAEPEVVEAIGWHDDAINDLQQAIPALKSQIDAVTKTSGSTTENVSSATVNTTTTASTIGTVNNQLGASSYATAQSDYGAFILLGSGGPVDVSLTGGPAIQLPWYATFLNYDSGPVTLTPDSGAINYWENLNAADMPLDSTVGATVVYDGAAYWAVRYPPGT